MRIIAIILNAGIIGFIVVLLIINHPRPGEWLSIAGILIFLVFNTITLGFTKTNSWLARFWERKRLEEVKRIKVLEREIEQHSEKRISG